MIAQPAQRHTYLLTDKGRFHASLLKLMVACDRIPPRHQAAIADTIEVLSKTYRRKPGA